ncbi:MAG: hypothetical protein ABI947_12055 [Chloroflexota bacterium]
MQNTLNSTLWNAPGETLRRWWKSPAIRIPVLIFVTARFLTLIIGVTAVQLGPVYNPYVSDKIFVESLEARQPSSFLAPLIDPWHRWDTGWYLKVAVKGYSADDGSVIFAPLYPALSAAVGVVVGDTLLGALIVSSIACLAFLLILYQLAQLETHSERVASTTLLALIAFPTAFYLLAGYTESPFLAFVAGTLLAARQRRWWIVTVLAALATLTRIQGSLLIFPIAWLAFVDTPRFWQGITWRERIRQSIPRLAAMGSGPLMALCFFGYLWLEKLGTVSAAYEKYWALEVRAPWESVIDVIGRIVAGHASATEIMGLVALVIIVVLAVASLRVLPFAYQCYMWPTLALILMRYYTPTLLNGTMRYVLDFFPIFITAAVFLARHPRWRLVWISVGVVLQLFMVFLFARWMWIA